MSDGGEGLLDAAGGTAATTTVTGPLGAPVEAEWRLLRGRADGPTAVIEMARAAGRALLPRPRGDDPVRAGTAGVGQLLLAARDAGRGRIVVGCGGSATTDGGRGRLRGRGLPGRPGGDRARRRLRRHHAASSTPPRCSAPRRAPPPAQVDALGDRLAEVAARYRARVRASTSPAVPGAGAAGRPGGRPASRSEPASSRASPWWPGWSAWPSRLERADLVVTGEGHLDPPSFHGKVPGGVLELARGRDRRPPLPVLCIAGGADRALLAAPPDGMEIVSLSRASGGHGPGPRRWP